MSDSEGGRRYTGTLLHNLDPNVPFESEKYPSDTRLLKYVAERRWQQAEDHLKSGPHYVYPLAGYERLPRIKETGFASMDRIKPTTPLHLLMDSIEIPPSVVSLLIDESEDVLKWPDLTEEGLTPLHYACSRTVRTGNANEKLIFVGLLLEKFPKAAWILSKPKARSLADFGEGFVPPDDWSVGTVPDQTYPFHALLSSENVTVALCEKFCQLRPPRGDPPQIELKDKDNDHYPIMRAIDYHAPDDVIFYLLKQSEHMSAREHACVPMQSAAFIGCTMPVLRMLLKQPGMLAAGAKETDSKFPNPLHYLVDSEAIERWPYEHNTKELRQDLVSAQDMMRIFIQIFARNSNELFEPDEKARRRKKQRYSETHPDHKPFWLKQIQRLIKGKENGQTVLDRANDLQAEIMKKNKNRRSIVLQNVIDELEEIKNGTFKIEDFDEREDWVRAWKKFKAEND